MFAEPVGDPLPVPARGSGSELQLRGKHRLLLGAKRVLTSRWAAVTSLAAAVVAFAGAWTGGGLVIDGPGTALYVRLAVDHLMADGRVPYWMPELWAGTPAWAVAPSLEVFVMVPVAALFGPTVAVKLATLCLQVVGAWGAFVLARSLWRNTAAALVAGLVYGLSPIVVSLGALFGSESSVGVIAATPWLVWSLRKGLRGDGTRYVVGAGLITAFAVLHQAEYAYGLALLCACLTIIEIGRIRRGLGHISVGRLLAREGLAAAVCLGAISYWLMPFLALHKSFILSPPELVQGELASGIANTVGRELGLFLHRSSELHGVVSPFRPALITHVLYLGWVPLGVTILTAALLARRDDEGTLSAVLLASVIAVWMSTASVSLAGGGPVARGQVLPLAATGLVAGLVLGGFLRRVGLRRARVPVLAAAAAFLFVAPYLTPFLLLRRAVPLLGSIRFPRLYVVAILGLALGTAWPVAHLARRRADYRPRLVPLAASALAVILFGAILVDAWPYRSFYRLQSPPDAAAYRQASAVLSTRPRGARVLPDTFEPRTTSSLLRAGADLSLAWPHPLAGTQVWRLTVEGVLGPPGYASRALGLSATAYVAHEQVSNPGTAHEAVSAVTLQANPRNLPIVRAYDQALVVGDRSITPELAVALAHRNIGVVHGGLQVQRTLTGIALVGGVTERACDAASTAKLPIEVAGEVGRACGMGRWLPTTLFGTKPLGGDSAPGSTFMAAADRLRGVGVWLYDPSGQSQLVLHELAADNRSVGPEVARARASGADEYGMTSFTFDPVPHSAGKRYVFDIECPDCFDELAPQMLAGRDENGRGNLLLGGRLDPSHMAAFAPVYEQLPPATASSNTLDWHRPTPGRWRIESSGIRPALVVVADADFPGWRARVDGHPAPVLEADGAFLGVPVPPGKHEIVLDYHRPVAADIGRVITAGTLLIIVVAGLCSRRKARRPSNPPESPAPAAVSAEP